MNKGNIDENALRSMIIVSKDSAVLSLSQQIKVLFKPPLKRLIILYLMVNINRFGHLQRLHSMRLELLFQKY